MKVLTWNNFVRLVLSYAIFIPNEDGSWTVEVPSLPGCVTWSETRAEAAVMAEDAVQGWLLIALRFGDEIPSVDGYSLDYSMDYQLESEMSYA